MATPIKYHDEWILANIDKYPNYEKFTYAYNEKFNTNIKYETMCEHCRKKLNIDKDRQKYFSDEWIIKNIDNFKSYTELTNAHNELFNTNITLTTMKNHCRFKLNLSKKRKNYINWTNEEDEWLRNNYSLQGVDKSLLQLNKIFGNHRTKYSIKCRAITLGIQVDENVAISNKLQQLHYNPNSLRHIREIGATREDCGRLVMKKANGTWEQASRVIYGDVPKNHSVIFLDNNPYNLSKENLRAIPLSHLGLLSKYKMKSDNAKITETAIKWCNLYMAIKEE